jgi:hypothetical protein
LDNALEVLLVGSVFEVLKDVVEFDLRVAESL